MDFTKLKQKAMELKETATEKGKKAVEFGAGKLADSKMTLKNVEELKKFIETSKNTEGKDSKTGEKKTYTHRSIVIFCDTKSSFFKEMLYLLVVLEAKAFSQNIKLKLADISMENIDKKEYGIGSDATLVVFENTKKIKVVSGEEKIEKVVKSPSLDINKTIDEL